MKKTLCILLTLFLLTALSACDGKSPQIAAGSQDRSGSSNHSIANSIEPTGNLENEHSEPVASAASTDFFSEEPTEPMYNDPIETAFVGDIIEFGAYEQDGDESNGKEPIQWVVLDREADRILVLSKYGLDYQPYQEDYQEVTWETCTMRKWLNRDFRKAAFTSEELRQIPFVDVRGDNNPRTGISSGKMTQDRVFLLSLTEAGQYLVDNDAVYCEPTAYAVSLGAPAQEYYQYADGPVTWWWLRTPGYEAVRETQVTIEGKAHTKGTIVTDQLVVRPAMWLVPSRLAGELEPDEEEPVVESPYELSQEDPYANANPGDTIVLGSYEQDNDESNGKEPIEWMVLDRQDNKILIISKYALDCQQYHIERESVTWETCTLRQWLNETFLNEAFTMEEQKPILMVTNPASKCPGFTTNQGNETKDKVFLLSGQEVTSYFENENDTMCTVTAYAVARGAYLDDRHGTCPWWTRSLGRDQTKVAPVGSVQGLQTGAFQGYANVDDDNLGVRPAMWIYSSSN